VTHELFVRLTHVVSDSPTEPGAASLSVETLLEDLILEWRTRRGIDTDATHATRVGCAEQLENVLQAIRQATTTPGMED
jgi:hypothetical protein